MSTNSDKKNSFKDRRKKPDMSPMLYGKMPPQSTDIEGAVLGACMLNPNSLEDVLTIIPEGECFYADANQRIYAALKRMSTAGTRIDFMTVCEELRKSSELEMVGGSYYVTGLTRDVVSSANIEEHALIIMQKYMSRESIRISGEVINDAYEDSTDIFDLINSTQTKFEELMTNKVRKDFRHISSGASEVLAKTYELMNSEVKLAGIPSGFPELDRLIGGWEDGTLTVIGARPRIGKTAFALNLAMNAYFNQVKSKPVGIFSLEMSEAQLIQRILANRASVALNKIRKGTCDKLEFETLSRGKTELDTAGIYIDDTAAIKLRELRIKAKKMKRKHDVGLIIIDYLQLMTGDDNIKFREQEIAGISSGLKSLAKDLGIPIIALAQLNRGVESRTDPEPQLSDFRESGSIEQDADTVIFLYRTKDSRGEIIVSVAKSRHDREDKLVAYFIGEYQRFAHMKLLSELNGPTVSGTQFPITDNFQAPESTKVVRPAQAEIPMLNTPSNNSIKADEADDLPF
mgnify:CR=1 FL=1